MKKIKGQSVLEYAMIVAVVVAALMAMGAYVRRSVQANLRIIEDQINASVPDGLQDRESEGQGDAS